MSGSESFGAEGADAPEKISVLGRDLDLKQNLHLCAPQELKCWVLTRFHQLIASCGTLSPDGFVDYQ